MVPPIRTYTGDLALDAIIAREIRYGQTRALEVVLSLIMVGTGVVLLVPLETFVGPQWRMIARFIGELEAGLIALATGGLRIIALYINGRRHETPVIRVAGCIGGFFFWLAVSVGFVASIPPLSLGIVLFPVFALAELYSSSRAGGDIIATNSFGIRSRLLARAKKRDAHRRDA